jgi:Ribbon-helix-helix protein, copG family
MIYIMRRTQLYLDEQLWTALHTHARNEGTTVSELVRSAVRDRYLGDLDERRKAMQAVVGIRKNRRAFDDSEGHVRRLRSGDRLERIVRE